MYWVVVGWLLGVASDGAATTQAPFGTGAMGGRTAAGEQRVTENPVLQLGQAEPMVLADSPKPIAGSSSARRRPQRQQWKASSPSRPSDWQVADQCSVRAGGLGRLATSHLCVEPPAFLLLLLLLAGNRIAVPCLGLR